MPPIIGIDLGTTTSEIAIYRDGRPVVIENDRGSLILPSVVAIDSKTRQLKIGEEADSIQQQGMVIREIKREMGREIKVKLGDKEYSPEEISSMILRQLKQFAEDKIGEKISEAVITVPANFSIEAKKATEIAAQLAEIEPLRIIQEPTSAALAYGLVQKEDEVILVYDLGGGTFDVSIVEIFDGNVDVKAHDGDRQLGGKDFDDRILQYAIDYLRAEHNFDCSNDDKRKFRLKSAAKKTKEELSFSDKATLSIPAFGVIENRPFNLQLEITRSKFEELTSDLISKTITLTEAAIKKSKYKKEEIQKVLLVGGSTRMPCVVKALRDFFGFEPSRDVEPDLVVSMGACIQAAIIKGETDAIIMDRVAYGFGIEAAVEIDGVLVPGFYSEIIKPNTPMLQDFTEEFRTIRDYQTEVELKCFQREPSNTSEWAKDCVQIGESQILENIPSAKAGEIIEVTMRYNLNGIMDMIAHVKSTGFKKKFEIKTAAGVLNEQTGSEQRAKLDALWKKSKHADKAASLINSVEKRLDKMSMDDAKLVESLVDQLKVALINEDLDKVEDLIDQITEILINY